jgi:hypothetical protein
LRKTISTVSGAHSTTSKRHDTVSPGHTKTPLAAETCHTTTKVRINKIKTTDKIVEDHEVDKI